LNDLTIHSKQWTAAAGSSQILYEQKKTKRFLSLLRVN